MAAALLFAVVVIFNNSDEWFIFLLLIEQVVPRPNTASPSASAASERVKVLASITKWILWVNNCFKRHISYINLLGSYREIIAFY